MYIGENRVETEVIAGAVAKIIAEIRANDIAKVSLPLLGAILAS